MNELFRDKNEFDKLISATGSILYETKNTYRKRLLSLEKKDIIRELNKDNRKLHPLEYMTGLSVWLKRFFLTPDNEIIEKFDYLGFDGNAKFLFRDIDEIFGELTKMHSRNIVFLDYLMAIHQITEYLELRILCFIFTDDDVVIYTDRQKTEIKNELDNIKKRVKRSEKLSLLSILLNQINEKNEYGFSLEEFISHIALDKFDSYYFSRFFAKYVSKTDESFSKKKMFIELYDLFRLVTQDPNFISHSEYSTSFGYDNWENYQALHVMRLLINRSTRRT